jgi:PD-(D/E)XK nuclease superfamily protein
VLTTDHKGAIAETAIVAAATKLGVGVLKPMHEGGRYDLVFDVDGSLLRIQCKWAARYELRLAPRLNNQRLGINWAEDYAFEARLGGKQGAVAQLGERLHGMQEVTGSSPVGSIFDSLLTEPPESPPLDLLG